MKSGIGVRRMKAELCGAWEERVEGVEAVECGNGENSKNYRKFRF